MTAYWPAWPPLRQLDGETEITVTSWLTFVQTAILDWIDNPTLSREQLRDLCIRTLCAAVDLEADAARSKPSRGNGGQPAYGREFP